MLRALAVIGLGILAAGLLAWYYVAGMRWATWRYMRRQNRERRMLTFSEELRREMRRRERGPQ